MSRHLFHFTCDHSYPKIGRRGLLLPQQKPKLFGVPLPDFGVVWLTEGSYESTGMDQSDLAICDRSAYRYIVTDDRHCEHWIDSMVRQRFLEHVAVLEAVGKPELWWVSSAPVPVRLG